MRRKWLVNVYPKKAQNHYVWELLKNANVPIWIFFLLNLFCVLHHHSWDHEPWLIGRNLFWRIYSSTFFLFIFFRYALLTVMSRHRCKFKSFRELRYEYVCIFQLQCLSFTTSNIVHQYGYGYGKSYYWNELRVLITNARRCQNFVNRIVHF